MNHLISRFLYIFHIYTRNVKENSTNLRAKPLTLLLLSSQLLLWKTCKLPSHFPSSFPSGSLHVSCIYCMRVTFSSRLHDLATMQKEEEHTDKEEKLALELTILSAESLKSPSSIIPFRVRPYVAISRPLASFPELRTGIDESGMHNPTFNHTFRVPLSPSFFKPPCSKNNDSPSDAVHVSILSKRPLLGPAEIGWCRICASDVMDGYKPPAVRRRLSYALRSPRDGCKGHGYVHVAARVVGPGVDCLEVAQPKPQPGWCRVAIGIPVAGPAAQVWEQRSRGAWSDVASFGRK